MTKAQTNHIRNAIDNSDPLTGDECLFIVGLAGHNIDYKLTEQESETLGKISRKYTDNA